MGLCKAARCGVKCQQPLMVPRSCFQSCSQTHLVPTSRETAGLPTYSATETSRWAPVGRLVKRTEASSAWMLPAMVDQIFTDSAEMRPSRAGFTGGPEKVPSPPVLGKTGHRVTSSPLGQGPHPQQGKMGELGSRELICLEPKAFPVCQVLCQGRSSDHD